VGHPLFDELEQRRPDEAAERLLTRHGPELVGVFPGSRRHEVQVNLPVMLDACLRIRRELPGVAFGVLTLPALRATVEKLLRRSEVEMQMLGGIEPVDLARASRVCITKSGTITLEIASQGTPMIIYYRASPLVAFLAWGLSETPCAGLINCLAGREICPEKATPRRQSRWIAEQALRLLTDEAAHRRCAEAMAGVLDGYAQPGASERAARGALSLLD
jgi:lipid-A-disaccharide synthase